MPMPKGVNRALGTLFTFCPSLPWPPLQWVHPAINGVSIAEDPRPLHNDLHTYLRGEHEALPAPVCYRLAA